jgi:N-acyl-D-amino-acid deacylase
MRGMIMAALAATALAGRAAAAPVVVAGGLIVDGSGGAPYPGWLAMEGDRITAMGKGAAPAGVTSGAALIDSRDQPGRYRH